VIVTLNAPDVFEAVAVVKPAHPNNAYPTTPKATNTASARSARSNRCPRTEGFWGSVLSGDVGRLTFATTETWLGRARNLLEPNLQGACDGSDRLETCD
jgi:hypothetical protein